MNHTGTIRPTAEPLSFRQPGIDPFPRLLMLIDLPRATMRVSATTCELIGIPFLLLKHSTFLRIGRNLKRTTWAGTA